VWTVCQLERLWDARFGSSVAMRGCRCCMYSATSVSASCSVTSCTVTVVSVSAHAHRRTRILAGNTLSTARARALLQPIARQRRVKILADIYAGARNGQRGRDAASPAADAPHVEQEGERASGRTRRRVHERGRCCACPSCPARRRAWSDRVGRAVRVCRGLKGCVGADARQYASTLLTARLWTHGSAVNFRRRLRA
jgi:hypothetical protein